MTVLSLLEPAAATRRIDSSSFGSGRGREIDQKKEEKKDDRFFYAGHSGTKNSDSKRSSLF